jgi:hypothetical protein
MGNLILSDEILEKDEIVRGKLHCPICKLDFAIEEKVPIFGIKRGDEEERLREMKGENEWTSIANDIQAHIDFAKRSSQVGERIIQKLDYRTKKGQASPKLRVLDAGSGWGSFQAWQFTMHGYEVVAAEMCP